MTVTIKLPGTLASTANLPVQRDYVADLANDSRCLGLWRFNEDYATLSGSDVTEFANLKTGGAAMASTSYRGQLAMDNVIGRKTLLCANADPVQYEIAIDLSGNPGLTFCAGFRPLNDASRIIVADGADAMILQSSASGGGAPQLRAYLGADFATITTTGDKRRLMKAMFALDSSDDISLAASGETTVTAATTDTVQTTTTLFVGSQNGFFAPEASIDMVAVFGVDMNHADNADLLAIYDQFLAEIYRS